MKRDKAKVSWKTVCLPKTHGGLECFSILDAYDADINAENAIEDQGGAEVNGAEVNGEGAEVNGEGAEEDEGGDVEIAEEDEGGMMRMRMRMRMTTST
ncbi:hypothetical protein L2E82_15751 [Cichorium intybus]|uniref:Uncharacterized protein n=1 Tax=Cichorium intybus TaxID=13427 RepID=A0ACB9F3P1_CICIN|nr:hypothetical protein L2E82_15751 [Cichorium intybus]